MDALLFAANAVLPILLMVLLGYLLRNIGLCDSQFAKKLNKLCFKIFLPVMLFINLYSGGGVKKSDLEIIGFVSVACIVMFLVGLLIVTIFIKEPAKKGVVLQCAFRSNFAIIGLPLAQSIAGDEGARLAAVASVACIPLFNTFAVISLSIFNRSKDGQKGVNISRILKSIVTNPLIIGVAAGMLAIAAEALLANYFDNAHFSNIKPVYSVLNSIKSATTPMMLISLGAQFEFKAAKKLLKPILVGTLSRLLIMPVIILGGALLFFPQFSAAHFAVLLSLSGTPVAVSSAIMASEMDADSELAGQFVVWTTLFSVLSVFCFISLFRTAGIF